MPFSLRLARWVSAGVLGAAVLGLTTPVRAAMGPPAPLPRPFGRGLAFVHTTEIAPYSFEQTVLRLRFDLARQIVYGDETVIVHPKNAGLASLPFDSAAIHYDSVKVNGRVERPSIDEARQRVIVPLDRSYAAGSSITVDFHYWAKPTRGLYFVLPDAGYPNIVPEVWTQGEPIDNRRWFPTWDQPNEKTPVELIATVPSGWTVVGNGLLRHHTSNGKMETWDWVNTQPMSTYLVAFTAGPMREHHTTLGAMDVDSFVPPGEQDMNAECFGDTNQMIAYYNRRIGVNFPWSKYDQTAVKRDMYGGMENASDTIVTDLALHPKIEDVENSCDQLVSHELAQEYYGDGASMTNWANIWLHEGFATYFEELWTGQRFGPDAFAYARYQAQQIYFAETQKYYRPIVDDDYADAIDLFDSSSHERPAQVLHMLRYMFGDARFFGATAAYLRQYDYKNADTHDFFVSIERSLGVSLGWFEQEWFHRSAYPHYVVSQRYDPGSKTLFLGVKQHNHDGLPFRMPIVIEAVAAGHAYRIMPTIDRNEQTVAIHGVPSQPEMVLFDPGNNILRQLTFPKSTAELAYQAQYAPALADREWALTQLAASPTSSGEASICRAARSDAFQGVRADAVGLAAAANDATAIDAALHDPDVRVRIAAETGAGSLHDHPAGVVATLATMTGDANPDVASAALTALGSMKADGAYDRLMAAVDQHSFREQIASGALQGLAALGDDRAFATILARTRYGVETDERDTAIVSLAQLAAQTGKREAARHVLTTIVSSDPLIASRLAAAQALGTLGDASAVPVLQHVEQSDTQVLVQIVAWGAIQDIRDAVAMRAYRQAHH